MKNKNLFIFSIVILILINPVFAQNTKLDQIIEGIFKFVGATAAIGLVSQIASISIFVTWAPIIAFFMFIVLPFITVFAIVHGFLMEMKIFRSKTTNLILALTISTFGFFVPLPIFGVPNPIFYWLFSFLFSLMAPWAIIIFSLMFFVGIWYIYLTKKRQWGTGAGVYAAYRDEAKGLRFELRSVNEALSDAMRKMAQETNPDKRAAIERSVQELSDRRNDVSERIRQLDQARRQF